MQRWTGRRGRQREHERSRKKGGPPWRNCLEERQPLAALNASAGPGGRWKEFFPSGERRVKSGAQSPFRKASGCRPSWAGPPSNAVGKTRNTAYARQASDERNEWDEIVRQRAAVGLPRLEFKRIKSFGLWVSCSCAGPLHDVPSRPMVGLGSQWVREANPGDRVPESAPSPRKLGATANALADIHAVP